MDTMKAVVFHGINDLRLEEVPKPRPRAGEAVIRITTTTICGTDVHIVRGEYPVARADPRTRAGRRHRGARRRPRGRLPRRPARDRRRDHAVRPVFLLPERGPLAVRRRARRLALRQHHQRRVGRVPAGARCARQPRADSGRADRRRGAAAARHLFDRPVRRRERTSASATRGGVRAGPDRPVRDARREAERRVAHHRRRPDRRPARDGAALWRQRHAQPDGQRPRRRDQAADRRARRRRRDRGARTQETFENALRATPPGRHAVEPRRLLRQAGRALRGALTPASAIRRS